MKVNPERGWPEPIRLQIDKANECVYLGPGSAIHTELEFSSFFGTDHTLSAWFMPQWVYADDGPLFASADGRFMVGQGDYQKGNAWTTKPKVAGDPLLTVVVDGKRSIYRAPSGRARRGTTSRVSEKARRCGCTSTEPS